MSKHSLKINRNTTLFTGKCIYPEYARITPDGDSLFDNISLFFFIFLCLFASIWHILSSMLFELDKNDTLKVHIDSQVNKVIIERIKGLITTAILT